MDLAQHGHARALARRGQGSALAGKAGTDDEHVVCGHG
jgi:hypothetical protein